MATHDAKLRQRIAWLNTAGGFENGIVYSKVAEAGEDLEIGKVMDVLKYLEDNYDKVWDPTAWVCSSLHKAREAGTERDPDIEAVLRRRIRWLNNDGGFENTIIYTKVADAAVGLTVDQVMSALHLLESRWQSVEDPTAWVCTALRKAAQSEGGGYSGSGGTGAGGSGGWSQSRASGGRGQAWDYGGDYGWISANWDTAWDEFEPKLKKRIRWLNTNGGFDNAIIYDKVAEHAYNVDGYRVFEILKRLESNWEKVSNPTSWICRALRAEQGDWDTTTSASKELDTDADRRLRRRVRWLNNAGGFNNAIIYSKIAAAAAGGDKVFDVLDKLEDRGPKDVQDPTWWVCKALDKDWYNSYGGYSRN